MSIRAIFSGLMEEGDLGIFLSLALCVTALLVVWISLKKARELLRKVKVEKEVLEGEEHRMFEFLHMLGHSLEKDHSASKLNREIVEGISSLVKADGAAIYLLDRRRENLLPKYLSKHCPPLIGLPVEVLQITKGDDKALRSHVKLSKVPSNEGVLGAVLGSGVPQVIVDLKNHDAFKDAFIHYEGDYTAMGAPLSYGGKDLGVIFAARKHETGLFTKSEFDHFRSASEQASFALGNAMIHREAGEKRKMESELRTAREVQSVLLPNEQPNIPGYRIEGMNKPARIISGDYYDYIPLGEGRWAVVIADVSGKGVAAGLLMAMCRSVLRAELVRDPDPLKAMDQVNRQIFPDIREDAFISLALYVINENDGKVQLVRAGHDKAPLLRKGAKEVEWLKPPGLAIGLDDGDVFARVNRIHEFEMESGDCLLIYTDGVTEAENLKEEQFGHERMVEVFSDAAPLGAEKIVRDMEQALHKFVSGVRQGDDITMIAVEKR
ncbi:hypothetical protein Rhal01_00560 [Rubritalea halochordaticola]|uniref:GAF domain-containing protein n=1 Tax=Rubritalea halochordaticola TaxID=714537 RepID=A0ABP9UVA8_9BACT